jgi:tRNA pseudouridine55 synthase
VTRKTTEPGLLLVDKPSGPTSHDVVAAIRRGIHATRVGHAGTLDPLATGLLVICLGAATRLSEYLAGKDKRYQARIRLGQATTTYDAQGAVTATSAVLPDEAAVRKALAGFLGPQLQVPPQFSAIKRGGQKAYEVARRGETLALEPRPVEFYSLDLVAWEPPDCTVEVHCSAGTYVRSLAHDLGERLGCGAHLAALRRTASGSFGVEAAVPLEALQADMAAGAWRRHRLPPDAGLSDWPALHLTAEAAAHVLQGRPVPLPPGSEGDHFRAYNPGGELIALLRADTAAGVLWPHKVFPPSE